VPYKDVVKITKHEAIPSNLGGAFAELCCWLDNCFVANTY